MFIATCGTFYYEIVKKDFLFSWRLLSIVVVNDPDTKLPFFFPSDNNLIVVNSVASKYFLNGCRKSRAENPLKCNFYWNNE